MTIGQRAAQLIEERAAENGTFLYDESEKLQICDDTRLRWKRGTTNPSRYMVAEMAKQGYDTHYILTGER